MTIASLLLAASLSHATSRPEREIQCSFTLAKESVQMRIEPNDVIVLHDGREEERHPIVSEKVQGKGSKARKVIRFKDGEISFKEVYGCLRDAKGTLNGAKLKELKCKDPFAPACDAGITGGPPKADK
jgi:hypothetical protein